MDEKLKSNINIFNLRIIYLTNPSNMLANYTIPVDSLSFNNCLR